jgi:hypothetical protein
LTSAARVGRGVAQRDAGALFRKSALRQRVQEGGGAPKENVRTSLEHRMIVHRKGCFVRLASLDR